MKKFKRIMPGLFNVMTVNRKLREIWDAIEEIRDVVYEGREIPESADVSEKVIVEPETEVATVDAATEQPFDWKTSDDSSALKEFALSEFNLEIKGNKKADTVRNEIYNHLESMGG